jgi:hypothetical protein
LLVSKESIGSENVSVTGMGESAVVGDAVLVSEAIVGAVLSKVTDPLPVVTVDPVFPTASAKPLMLKVTAPSVSEELTA